MSAQGLVQPKTNIKYIVFQVNFLLDRYHGKEWPPSPRRFFLAMIAALHQGSRRRIDTKLGIDALKFLENLLPPTIYAPYEQNGCNYALFVPNNDLDIIKKDLKNVLTNRTMQMKKIGARKNAKPYIIDGTIKYSWEVDASEPDLDKHVDLLKKIAREITVLGWGIDPVVVDCRLFDEVTNSRGVECYRYDEHSEEELIEVPVNGLLEDAKRHHAEWCKRIETNGGFCQPNPITKSASMPYRKDRHAIYDIKGFAIKNVDDENGQKSRRRMQVITVEEVGKIIHEVNSEKDKAIKSVAAGRESKIKTIPLPSIGSSKSDAKIRRIGFLVPSHMQNNVKDALSFLDGEIIKSGGSEWQFRSIKKDDGVLRAYKGKSKTWCSITPLELDVKHDASREEILDSIMQKMYDIATEIDFIDFRKEPYWNGLPKIVNHHDDKFRTYVDVEFKNPIKGPLVLDNSHADGKGVFAPKDLPDVAHYAIHTPIPKEKTITVGDQMRRSVMSKLPKIIPTSISGHSGSKRATNHRHAFWLPIDINQDGMIDHIIVYLPDGFNNTERHACGMVNALFGKGYTKTRLVFLGFSSRKKLLRKIPMFNSAYKWKSISPYFMPKHSKKRYGVMEQIKEECVKRGLSEPEITSCSTWMQQDSKNRYVRNFNFNRNGRQPPNTIGHFLEIKFPDKVTGPLNLGYGCHFGLGMFAPEEPQRT